MNTRELVEVLDGMEEFDGVSTVLNPIESASSAPQTLRELLTPKEFEMARMTSEGLAHRDIGLALGFSEQQSKNAASKIYWKLGICSRLELALRFQREKESAPLSMSTVVTNPVTDRRERTDNRSLAATAFNFRTCESCGHSLRAQMPEYSSQLWACRECGGMRQWGHLRPEDRQARPALRCDDCDAVTRHRFVRVG